MTVDEAIRALGTAPRGVLPAAAMQWALDHWDEAAPRFVELLDRCLSDEDRSDETRDAVFFILHLGGDRCEQSLFPGLCRLGEDAVLCEHIMGDAVTETYRDILISCYGGDPLPLKHLIEAEEAAEFARGAALEAMAYLGRAGTVPEDEVRQYLLQLRTELQPQAEHVVWGDWALALANLGYEDRRADIVTAFDKGLIDEVMMTLEDVDAQFAVTRSDPNGFAGFAADRIGPFVGAIETLSGWYGFSEKYRQSLEEELVEAPEEDPPIAGYEFGVPYTNPLRHVGRNDPCPCGSGKKYKKCCLQ